MVKKKKINISNKDVYFTAINLVVGMFLSGLCYNLFLLPNNIVVGGVSGLAIVVQEVFGLSSSLFIYVCNIILIVIAFFALGRNQTFNTVVGSLMYPLMVTFTAPIAKFILPYFQFDEFLIISLMAGLLNGFSSGLVYKCGYNTGGSDVIVKILEKYCNMSEGKATLIIYTLVMTCGAFVFGLDKAVYAIIIIYITSFTIDKVMFGISNSKTFYVFTRESEKVRKTILKEFESGFTLLPTKGGYSHEEGILIMCVLPNSEYYKFKKRILEIDPKAFFVIADCYESHGGFHKKNLPFM